MIRTTLTDTNKIQLEIDGSGGKATATLNLDSALSLRNRLSNLDARERMERE